MTVIPSSSWSQSFQSLSRRSAHVLHLRTQEVLSSKLQGPIRNRSLQATQVLRTRRSNGHHHPRNDAQLRRSRGRWMVVLRRIPSPQPLYLLQEASDPSLHPVLRRVRDRRPAISWRYNNSLQLRAWFLQQTSLSLSRVPSLLLLKQWKYQSKFLTWRSIRGTFTSTS